jgi:toxin ParE1/3/4
MAYSVRYLPRALRQLNEILTYLAERNPAAARRVGDAIRRSIARIADFPHSARPSGVAGIRELAVIRYPYIVFYSVDDDRREVHILRVRHTSQDPAEHLAD